MTTRLGKLVATTTLAACAGLASAGSVRCPEVPLPPGFDPTSPASLQSKLGDAPRILLALRSDHGLALERVLAEGYSPNVCVLGGSLLAFATANRQDLEILLAHGASPDSPLDSNGGTALLRAIDLKRFDSVDILLAHAADPRVIADGGETALLALTALVVMPDSDEHARQMALARRLIEAGASVNGRTTVRGFTPLMQSARRGDAATGRWSACYLITAPIRRRATQPARTCWISRASPGRPILSPWSNQRWCRSAETDEARQRSRPILKPPSLGEAPISAEVRGGARPWSSRRPAQGTGTKCP